MKILVTAAAVLATTACMFTSANAADLDTIAPPPVYTEVEYGSGWYLRGDIGYTWKFDTDDSTFMADKRYKFKNQDSDQNWSWGGGVGYTWNDYLRTDVTVDYYNNAKWKGHSYGSSCDGVTTGSCSSEDKAKADLTNIMFNGYWSLGEYYGFKPYLSGGLGSAKVDVSSFTSTQTCTATDGQDCPDGNTHSGAGSYTYKKTTTYDTDSEWKFSYSVGAGFDVRMDDNWVFDVGYRYVNIDDGKWVSGNGLNGPVERDNLKIHEVRAGIRYEIW